MSPIHGDVKIQITEFGSVIFKNSAVIQKNVFHIHKVVFKPCYEQDKDSGSDCECLQYKFLSVQKCKDFPKNI